MKTAIVLFNLGGPESPETVKPFLYNLFNDPAILPYPKLIRHYLAKFISARREKKAIEIYSHLGGRSPIVEQTWMQADALQERLGRDYKIFVCMRYWHPMTMEEVRAVKNYVPDEVVL